MKQLRLFIALVISMIALGLSAQELPQAINFQAIARDANGQALSNANIMLQLTVIDGTPDGSEVYREIRSLQTNAYGGFNFQLGRDPNMANGVFADIDWANGRKFLKVDYDPTDTMSFDLSLGTIEFISVPYAFVAGEVSYIDATNANDGDVLVFNAATGHFEPQAISTGGITEETDPTVPDWAKTSNKPVYDYSEIQNAPDVPEVPTNISAFENDANYLTEEVDPTVPAWAKESSKPAYDYSEIQNTPEVPEVPTNVSAFENDANYLTEETDPTVPAWAKTENKPVYDYSEIQNTPTKISAFENDAHYLTSYTETQTLADAAAKGNLVNAQIKNVTDPTEAQDAATKAYVDKKNAEIDAKIDYMKDFLMGGGTLDGLFSVREGKQVRFSKGNLQYQASTGLWRFAKNQWDFVGSDNENISPTYDGWIDLFGWGTGSNPTCVSPSNDDYATFTDWGMASGGNWRTLTKDEWNFLMFNRTTTSGIRYAKATVNGVTGVIILPDDWNTSYYTLSSTNTTSAAFTANTITSANWTSKFEAHGAVFLPAACRRNGTSVTFVGAYGFYWSSSPNGSDYAYGLGFYGSDLGMNFYSRYPGQSVRLVAEE